MLTENLVTEQSTELITVQSLELFQVSEVLKAKTGLSRDAFLKALGREPEKITDVGFIKLAKMVGVEKMPTAIFKKRFLNIRVSNLSGEVNRLKRGLSYIAIHFDIFSNNLILESTCCKHKVNIGLGKELLTSTEKLNQLFGKHWSDTRPSEKSSLTKLRNSNFDKRTRDSLIDQYGSNLPKVIENNQIKNALKKGHFRERGIEKLAHKANEMGFDIIPKVLIGNEPSIGKFEPVLGFNPEIHAPSMEKIEPVTDIEPLDALELVPSEIKKSRKKERKEKINEDLGYGFDA
jgi:hypothetical protein